jgi:hypothetical protein
MKEIGCGLSRLAAPSLTCHYRTPSIYKEHISCAMCGLSRCACVFVCVACVWCVYVYLKGVCVGLTFECLYVHV